MSVLSLTLQPRKVAVGILAAVLLSAAALLSACGGGGGGTTPAVTMRDLSLTLTGFDEHVGQRTALYVTDASNYLWLSAVYDPLPAGSLNLTCPTSLSNQRSYNCSIWIDENGNGTQDTPPTDANWVMPIGGNGMMSMMHNDNHMMFDPASFGREDRINDFIFNATGGLDDGDVGMGFEVRVIDLTSGRTVGVYHLGAIPATTFSVSLPKIINAASYQVDFYLDENDNGRYDAPPVDHAWRRLVTVTGNNDLVVNFTHDMMFTDIGF